MSYMTSMTSYFSLHVYWLAFKLHAFAK